MLNGEDCESLVVSLLMWTQQSSFHSTISPSWGGRVEGELGLTSVSISSFIMSGLLTPPRTPTTHPPPPAMLRPGGSASWWWRQHNAVWGVGWEVVGALGVHTSPSGPPDEKVREIRMRWAWVSVFLALAFMAHLILVSPSSIWGHMLVSELGKLGFSFNIIDSLTNFPRDQHVRPGKNLGWMRKKMDFINKPLINPRKIKSIFPFIPFIFPEGHHWDQLWRNLVGGSVFGWVDFYSLIFLSLFPPTHTHPQQRTQSWSHGGKKGWRGSCVNNRSLTIFNPFPPYGPSTVSSMVCPDLCVLA